MDLGNILLIHSNLTCHFNLTCLVMTNNKKCLIITRLILTISLILYIIINFIIINNNNNNKINLYDNNIITNNDYQNECYLTLNKSETRFDLSGNIKFHRKELKPNCRKNFTNIVVAFGSYCNQLTLYWFHRCLYSILFISTKPPKYIFISINNLKSSFCTNHNNNKTLYQLFIEFIQTYFNGKVQIFLYFHNDQLHDSQQRNFLTLKINEYFNFNTNGKKESISIHKQYFDNIIVSFFDSDDIIHPQKYEIIDYLYSHKEINGTILHQFYKRLCRGSNFILSKYENITNEMIINRKYEQIKLNNFLTNIVNINNNNNNRYNIMLKYHVKEIINLINRLTFPKFIIKLNDIYSLNRMLIMSDDNDINMSDINEFGKLQQRYAFNKNPFANGWPITTLNILLNTLYDDKLKIGYDLKFNLETIIKQKYYLYLLNIPLGIYCVGNISHKLLNPISS